MTRSEAETQLQECIVRVSANNSIGCGFFIKNNLIITCAHVIHDADSSEVYIYWKEKRYEVISTKINKKNDLALLYVNIKCHPLVLIDEEIEIGDECYSYGYPENYTETGVPITFNYEGKNKYYLNFKSGQFQSGFSGSPILNLNTFGVCGVVKRTRDEYSSLGGRGIPISLASNFDEIDFINHKSFSLYSNIRQLVWKSDINTANNLQPSILALVEVFLSVSLSFYIYIFYGIYWHIITGTMIAPLFFLKTKKSERDAIALFLLLVKKFSVRSKFNIKKIPLYIILFFIKILIIIHVLFALSSILYLLNPSFENTFVYNIMRSKEFILILLNNVQDIKVFSLIMFGIFLLTLIIPKIITFSLYAKFISIIKNISYESIKQIPKNWFRIVLSTDSFYPVEVLFGIEKEKNCITDKLQLETPFIVSYFFNKKFVKDNMFLEFSTYNKGINGIRQFLEKTFVTTKNIAVFLYNSMNFILLPIVYLTLFVSLFPFLYFRLIIKSSFWVYLPLVWLIEPQNKSNLVVRMKIESQNFMAYFMFLYSLLVVFIFTLLPLLYPDSELTMYFKNSLVPEQIKILFFTFETNVWNISRFISSLITIIFATSFYKIILTREVKPAYGNYWGAKILSLRIIRTWSILFTLACTFYVLLFD